MKKAISVLILLTVLLNACAGPAAGTLRLPSSVKEIADVAFYRDASLDAVILPEGLISIGTWPLRTAA